MDLFLTPGAEDQQDASTVRPRVYSVSDITRQIKLLLEDGFPSLLVEGEISNLTQHGSGHVYFTLKDEQAQIKCVIWRSQTEHIAFAIHEGMKVIVKGRLSVYEKGGSYQLTVHQLQPQGVGELQLAFERLKRKLHAEGLFDARHKRNLPTFPQVVGVVTSGTGAAIRDILSVIRRRMPGLQVILAPVAVQGAGAAADIAGAIRRFDRFGKVDVLIVGRGGGSLEDLWAFNEEKVARAIFDCSIPIVSAVGHEIDVTVADLVADMRAATPSAAAELVAPDRAELRENLRSLHAALHQAVRARLEGWRRTIDQMAKHYALRQPENLVAQYRQRTDELERRLATTTVRIYEGTRQELHHLEKQLQTLNPRNTLQRGYSITRQGDRIVPRASQLTAQQRASVEFYDGTVEVEIKK